MTATTKTVGEIVLEQPSSMPVFEHYGIDYYCGGRLPLAEACIAKKLELSTVIAALEAAAKSAAAIDQGWSRVSLENLSAFGDKFSPPCASLETGTNRYRVRRTAEKITGKKAA